MSLFFCVPTYTVSLAARLKRLAAVFMFTLALAIPSQASDLWTYQEQDRKRTGHTIGVLANTALAIWAFNSAYNAPKARTRDFGRIMTYFFGLTAVIHFGGKLAE